MLFVRLNCSQRRIWARSQPAQTGNGESRSFGRLDITRCGNNLTGYQSTLKQTRVQSDHPAASLSLPLFFFSSLPFLFFPTPPPPCSRAHYYHSCLSSGRESPQLSLNTLPPHLLLDSPSPSVPPTHTRPSPRSRTTSTPPSTLMVIGRRPSLPSSLLKSEMDGTSAMT